MGRRPGPVIPGDPPLDILWRGSLLPLDCTAVLPNSGAASRPSGSKLPRHSSFVGSGVFFRCLQSLNPLMLGMQPNQMLHQPSPLFAR
ncbi:hypothetical protein E4T63_14335 [Pseudomonas fluorescens]|uniref:Uncharacterized protein n=1 Tax=Pseudomonas fluorescens TaxID=294 RepID=A0AAP8Z1X0_PSEFL|nr:hypothetical protein E4T63_14335 [Pseudomonas fluorescens]